MAVILRNTSTPLETRSAIGLELTDKVRSPVQIGQKSVSASPVLGSEACVSTHAVYEVAGSQAQVLCLEDKNFT